MSSSPYRLFFKRKFPAKEGQTVDTRTNYIAVKLFIRFRRKLTTTGMPEIIESHIFAFNNSNSVTNNEFDSDNFLFLLSSIFSAECDAGFLELGGLGCQT